uniref:Uncharacterized protein n=1 Tax=Cacopsylla melanoneura TaxID=428564 RepID=A0A8D8XNE9_9HEMI
MSNSESSSSGSSSSSSSVTRRIRILTFFESPPGVAAVEFFFFLFFFFLPPPPAPLAVDDGELVLSPTPSPGDVGLLSSDSDWEVPSPGRMPSLKLTPLGGLSLLDASISRSGLGPGPTSILLIQDGSSIGSNSGGVVITGEQLSSSSSSSSSLCLSSRSFI